MTQPDPTKPFGMPDDHFVRQLRVVLDRRDDGVAGRSAIVPAMWAPGTQRPRIAILLTFVDVVAGYVPDGPRTPTIDLRLQTLGPVPAEGEVALHARPLRVGRSLIVSEVSLADARGRPFARASATFMNRKIEGVGLETPPPPRRSIASFEAMLDARPAPGGGLELVPHPAIGNGWVGTVQGGVQALLAECAIDTLAGDGREVVDLDIRYLSRLEAGPLRALPHSLGCDGDRESFSVALVDAGANDRLVSQVTVVARRAAALGDDAPA